jgi:hypothetical protein
MALIHYENWDGVTAPTIPAGWNVGVGFATSTAAHGITPTSSPNYLLFTPSSATTFFATYGTADGSGGNCTVSSNLQFFQVTGLHGRMGVTARGSASTLNLSSTSTYAAWVDFSANTTALVTIVSGTETPFYTYGIPLTPGDWYTMFLTCNGTFISYMIQRFSDGYWYDGGSSSWIPGQALVYGVTDSSITGSGYAGMLLEQTAGAGGFFGGFDDWYFNSIATILPVTPLIVRVPHAYYPQYAE